MEAHLFAEIAVNRFDNNLKKQVFEFIREHKDLSELYRKAEQHFSRRVVDNILEDFLVKGLSEHKPIFFSDDPDYALAEELLARVANEFIAQLPDRVFISIENDSELMDTLIGMPDALPKIQEDIRGLLKEKYFVMPTGREEFSPESNLLNSYHRMMLMSDEEV
ncbi:MAG: hypothetical protein ACRCSQ_01020 [Bacteroidales bacterium]